MTPQAEFTLKEIRQHVSAHFFKPNMLRSLLYFARDVIAIVLASLAIFFSVEQQQYFLAFLLSFISGNFFFALFVVGHDCGHGSFSRSRKVNNTVGFIAHQFLLTPYWAWKRSHAKHHRYSGNLNKDESIVPFSRDEAQQALGVKPNAPSGFFRVRVFNLLLFLTGINFHLYTLYNPRTKASHFWPNRVFLNPSDDRWIYLGSLVTLASVALLIVFAFSNPLLFLFGYLIPIMMCYHLMGLVTLMQHHDPDSRWFYDEDWNYVSGALNTFDYRYGRLTPLVRHWHHNIATYHVVHHLFLAIPHYHLKDVSEELTAKGIVTNQPKKFSYLGYLKILWRCNFVENNTVQKKQYELKAFEEL